MKAVVQRVGRASAEVAGEVVGSIGPGLVVLLGVGKTDDREVCRKLVRKIVDLRVFDGPGGRMDLSLLDVRGEMLVVSQFTLLADCRKGRRPDFFQAAPPDEAEPLYEEFIRAVEGTGVKVARGRFGASMRVELQNEGPVTLILEMEK